MGKQTFFFYYKLRKVKMKYIGQLSCLAKNRRKNNANNIYYIIMSLVIYLYFFMF